MRPVLAKFRIAAAGCLLAALPALPGCKSTPLGTGSNIVQLNLITVPVALNLDGLPGPDGISIRVYASAKDNPKQVAIKKGTLEVILFDGPFQRQGPPPSVLKQFTFAAEDLRRAEFTAEIGKGYQLALAWGTNVPTHRVISVAVRHTAPDGTIATSRPSSVTVLSK